MSAALKKAQREMVRDYQPAPGEATRVWRGAFNPGVVGDVELPVAFVERKVGANGLAEWRHYAATRGRSHNAQGLVWISAASAGRGRYAVNTRVAAPLLPKRQAERALGRLLRAGLVGRARPVFMRTGRVCPVRAVHGAEFRGIIVVPADAATRLRAMPDYAGWGGARVGAGRPRKSNGAPPRIQTARDPEEIRDLISLGSLRDHARARARTLGMGAPRPTSPVVSGASGRSAPTTGGGGATSGGSQPPDDPAARGADPLEAALAAPPSPAARPPTPAPRPPPEFYETYAKVEPVLPGAPELRPDDAPERRAMLLALWYAGAYERHARKRCWAFGRGSPLAGRHAALLRDAAEALLERRMAPAAWIAWSFGAWASMPAGRGGAPPPVAWVFSPARIDERAGWFGAEEHRYCPRACVAGGPLALDLQRRALAARAAFYRAPDAWNVGEHFPEGLDVAVAAARAEAAEATADLLVQASCGKWLW